MGTAECYAPQILVRTEGLPREKWLEYRRRGIGGSDAAAVLGISPFRTGRDLFYDKLNVVTADDTENWVQLEGESLLEPMVATIFAHKTGYKAYRRPFMFQHPLYPWMLADLDYTVELPDGTAAILEIKTTNYNAKDNWWYNGEEIVPIYYESQGRHYLAASLTIRLTRRSIRFCSSSGNTDIRSVIEAVIIGGAVSRTSTRRELASTPSALAISKKVSNRGILAPHSTLLIYLGVTDTFSASTACVSPFALRADPMRGPIKVKFTNTPPHCQKI